MARSIGRATGKREVGDGRNRIGALVIATMGAAGIAVGGTVAIYFVGSTAGLISTSVALPSLLGMAPMSPASVAVTALLATLGAAILLGALTATTLLPGWTFRVTATCLALASLLMPATIPGPPMPMRLVMAAMHFVVWVATVGALPRLATRTARLSGQ